MSNAFDLANDLYPLIEKVRGKHPDDSVYDLADAAEELAAEVTQDLSLRERVAAALRDENGLPPTSAALDVIMAVVDSTDYTDEQSGKAAARRGRDEYSVSAPTLQRYALDAEQKLRLLRKNR